MRRMGILLICFGILLCFSSCEKSDESSALLEMICLDVGQGSSTLLRTPSGDVLIDAGTEDGQDALCRRLKSLGVERLALLVLTHPDEDHIGGADGILEQFETDAVWTNGYPAENESYDRLCDALGKLEMGSTAVKTGDGITLGAIHVTVLAPLDEVADGNEGSLVLLLRCADFGALMMGDVPSETELALVETYGAEQLRADLLCVGHHGSDTSTCEEFLNAVRPSYAVVSCGAGNAYGHPDGRTLARLEQAGAEILRTDLEGDIVIRVYENGFRVAEKAD